VKIFIHHTFMQKYLLFFICNFLCFVNFAYSQPSPMIDLGTTSSVNTDGILKIHMMEHKVHLKIMRKLMTPAERLILMDDLMDSKTPELCMTLMEENYTDLETRAREKGYLLPLIDSTGMIFARMCG